MSRKKLRIDWLNHALEFFVVIIGILIAFQLNQCSTEKQEQRTVKLHLDEIEKETILNKASFQRTIEYSEKNLAKLDTILMLFNSEPDYNKINSLSLDLLDLSLIYYRKNAYTTLLESGDLNLINDYNSKKRIIDLYEYYVWVKSFDEISANLYSSDYYPYLKNNFDLIRGSVQPDSIYTTKEFKNILGAYHRTSFNKLEKYKDCLAVINKFLDTEITD